MLAAIDAVIRAEIDVVLKAHLGGLIDDVGPSVLKSSPLLPCKLKPKSLSGWDVLEGFE